ncbi:reverse transcriptase domain-containing protein [Tanacetum coccineum]
MDEGGIQLPQFNPKYGVLGLRSSLDQKKFKILANYSWVNRATDCIRHMTNFLEYYSSFVEQNGVAMDAIRLSLFPYSLMHHAIAWYDRLLRNSIHSFDDMRKFLSKYFPPSMVTKLRNEITKFEQKPHESLFEAWERYKLSIDRCPNHNMLLVTQIDTFYNGLTLSHRDTINAAAGGTFMQKTPEECYELIENMTAHHNHWDTSATRDETSRNISSTTSTESPEVVRQLELMNKNFLEMMRQIQSVKSVDTKCQTCGGPHSFTECPAASGYTQEAAYATTVLSMSLHVVMNPLQAGMTWASPFSIFFNHKDNARMLVNACPQLYDVQTSVFIGKKCVIMSYI